MMFRVLFCILVTFHLTESTEIGLSGYGIVVDAGSSGSRTYIYQWNPSDWTSRELPEISVIGKKKIHPGLSSFANNLDGVRGHIEELLQVTMEFIPEEDRAETPLLFMATAGLRLLKENDALELISKVEDVLDDASVNPFWHDAASVRILSGEGEGAFSWLAANYLSGNFGSEALSSTSGQASGQEFSSDSAGDQTFGVLEIGGASSQITFLPEVDPLADKFPLQILGKDIGIYTHSYLGYAQEAMPDWILNHIAEENPGVDLLEAPCMLEGDFLEKTVKNGDDVLFMGSGSPELCDMLVNEYFEREKPNSCHPKPCGLGSVYQPSIPDNMQFYLVAVYFYVARSLKLFPNNSTTIEPRVYREAAFEYCKRSYNDVYQEKGDDPYISMYCSSAILIEKLLTRGYGFKDDATNLHVIEEVNGLEISWSLGALIYEIERNRCGSSLRKSQIIAALQEVIDDLREEK